MNLCDFCYEEKGPGIQQVGGFFPEQFVGLQTSREGGVSAAPFHSFNLAVHVGDAPGAVAGNRERLASFLPRQPTWLEQVHGTDYFVIGSPRALGPRDDVRADASITAEPNEPCVVMTADCLPLLVARPATGQCAAIHAGWKGLAAGVIEKTLGGLLRLPRACSPLIDVGGGPRDNGGSSRSARDDGVDDDPWYVWLGPAIGQNAFEVGPEVREQFVQQSPDSAAAFRPSPRRKGHFLASLQALALLRISTFESVNPGVQFHVAIDRDCVFENPHRFFSFRRNRQTGRMASLIFRRIDRKA